MNEIITLKETIKKIENEITNERQNQINIFKKRFDSLKQTGEVSIKNEIIFSCMFGNGIML